MDGEAPDGGWIGTGLFSGDDLNRPEEVSELFDPLLSLLLGVGGFERVSPDGHVLASVAGHVLPSVNLPTHLVEGELAIIPLAYECEIGRGHFQILRERAVSFPARAVTACAIRSERLGAENRGAWIVTLSRLWLLQAGT